MCPVDDRFLESATNASMASGVHGCCHCPSANSAKSALTNTGRVAFHLGLGGEALTVGDARGYGRVSDARGSCNARLHLDVCALALDQFRVLVVAGGGAPCDPKSSHAQCKHVREPFRPPLAMGVSFNTSGLQVHRGWCQCAIRCGHTPRVESGPHALAHRA